ncbi:hypothetical protein [Rugamonas aquatica]|uniref:Uncharacterized protein n=1 Tax=Rugamonas aquatica TaxID=2743357 RepID=A0A6A7NBP7_9BURK|nr:hypothetical protein [Rugamonas aquatica]MQA42516.1 hypothetical protein [Rugamonas aquatica]
MSCCGSGLATPAQLQRSYDACCYARMFAPAAQLAQRFPGQLEVSPLIHVAADAGCHFSRAATDALAR